MRQVLSERMSFNQLLQASSNKPDNSRMNRAGHVSSKSLRIKSLDEGEAWTFSYKSQGNHSTTGHRHRGHIKFFKEDVSGKENAGDLECMVDCSCPDYKYRWAYNNAKADAGEVGSRSLNGNNGQPPRPRDAIPPGVGNLGEGLCKHLIALAEYLQTNVNAPEPEDNVPAPKIVEPKVKVNPPQAKQTIKAPDPDDSYSDSREDGYSDTRGGLEENKVSNLFNNMENFVRSNPEFNVQYE